MWVGTGDGLNRFDGYSFDYFTHSDNDSSSISDNNIWNMLLDSKGRLWVGTYNGLNLYDSKHETFRKFLFEPENKRVPNDNAILSLFEDSRHQLWATKYDGLYKIDIASLGVSKYNYENDTSRSENIKVFFEDSQGRIWASTSNGISIMGNAGIERIIPHSELPGGLPSDGIIGITQDRTGAIYVGTNGHGVLKLSDENDETFERFPSVGGKPFFGTEIIGALAIDKDGKLLVGTDGAGLFKQDDDGVFRKIIGSQSRLLLRGNVIHIFVDEHNTYWLSLFGSGVQVVYASRNRFEHYRYFDGQMERIEKNSVLAIAEDHDKKIWIGTDGAGLYKFDPKTKLFQAYRHSSEDKNTLSADVIKSLLVDEKNNLYAGTFGGGLNYLNTKTGNVSRYVHIPGDTTSISTNHVWSLYQGRTHRIYVGLLSGLDEFFPDKKVFSPLRFAGRQFARPVYSLEEDNEGNIWIGTPIDGLHRYDPVKNELMVFLPNQSDSASIPTSEIQDITVNSQGKFWIGSSNRGMFLFNPETFRVESVLPAFRENTITNILEDSLQNLWFTTFDGLHKWSHATTKIYDYAISDGLQGTQFNEGARLKSSDGTFYLGGTNGLNVFRPEQMTSDSTQAKVVFTKLSLFNTPVKVNDQSGILSASISQTTSITLQADQNVFSLEFASLDFNFPKKNKYRFYLEGFDKNWNDANASRTATYTNLPPATYTLRISTANRSGLWNENAASMTIIVMPRWYERMITKFAAALLLITITILIVHYRTKILFIQKIKLEDLVNRRTQELQMANVEIQKSNKELVAMEKMKENMLAVMSHEIRTPLNSMIGLTHVLKRRNPRTDQVEIIDTLKTSGDHLLHLVNDILDFNKIRSGKLDLEEIRFNLTDILKQLHAMFARLADDKNIHFSVQMSASLPVFVIGDSTRLLQILSNLVSNGIKFTPHGSVTLYAHTIGQTQDEVTVEFRVEDTGIGIPADKLHLLYEPFSQLRPETHRQYGGSGLGLLIVKNLVEAMNGTVAFKSVPHKTTTVSVTIPFKIENVKQSEGENDNYSKLDTPKHVRVLYVEDVASNRFLVKTLLADYEMDCELANDGKEAISKISKQEFDVILVDVQLPDTDGYELTARIRNDAESKNKETPVILFSAHIGIQEETIRKCGANDFIGKPFKPEDLLVKIEKNVRLGRYF